MAGSCSASATASRFWWRPACFPARSSATAASSSSAANCACRVGTTNSPYTSAAQKGQVLRLPIAHGEGCYIADERTLDELEAEDRVAFRYIDNANGSLRDIAGVLNRERNVMGMMPHPERATEPLMGSTDGLVVFESMLQTSPDRWCWHERRFLARNHRPAPAHARRVSEDRRYSGPRAHLHRTRHLQRDVERALLLQELAHSPEEAAHARQAGGAGTRRKRRHHRYRRRLRHRLQDRVAQSPQLHRALPGRGHRSRRHPARHLHHGRAPHRRAGFAALRPPGPTSAHRRAATAAS